MFLDTVCNDSRSKRGRWRDIHAEAFFTARIDSGVSTIGLGIRNTSKYLRRKLTQPVQFGSGKTIRITRHIQNLGHPVPPNIRTGSPPFSRRTNGHAGKPFDQPIQSLQPFMQMKHGYASETIRP